MNCFYWHRLFIFQGSNIPYIQMLIAMKEWAKRQSSWSYLKIVEILLHYTYVDYVAKLSATNGITIATTIQNISSACSVILFIIGKTTLRHIWNLNTILILFPIHKDRTDFLKYFVGNLPVVYLIHSCETILVHSLWEFSSFPLVM